MDQISKARETLVMWLRLSEGVSKNEFKEIAGISIDELYDNEITDLLGEGLLEWHKDFLRIPRKNRFISNTIYTALV